MNYRNNYEETDAQDFGSKENKSISSTQNKNFLSSIDCNKLI